MPKFWKLLSAILLASIIGFIMAEPDAISGDYGSAAIIGLGVLNSLIVIAHP